MLLNILKTLGNQVCLPSRREGVGKMNVFVRTILCEGGSKFPYNVQLF